MPAYLVAFKLARDGTYSRRFDNFMAHFAAGRWWAETGTSMIVHSDEPLDDFCRRVFSPAGFDDRVDIAVVLDLDHRDGRASGSFRYYELFNIVPWIERVETVDAAE